MSLGARKNNTMLPATEHLAMQNDAIGAIANLKAKAAKCVSKVHKMPSVDRNFESLSSSELARSTSSM
jgi:hypothetical protein